MADVEFRDGTRGVADYIASMLRGIETHRYTFKEAMGIANRRMESDYLEKQRSQIIKEHFRNLR